MKQKVEVLKSDRSSSRSSGLGPQLGCLGNWALGWATEEGGSWGCMLGCGAVQGTHAPTPVIPVLPSFCPRPAERLCRWQAELEQLASSEPPAAKRTPGRHLRLLSWPWQVASVEATAGRLLILLIQAGPSGFIKPSPFHSTIPNQTSRETFHFHFHFTSTFSPPNGHSPPGNPFLLDHTPRRRHLLLSSSR